MKIISYETARVTWLFHLEEFAPPAGANSPSILSQIAERYGFTIVPTITTRDDLNKSGLLFGMGRFQHGDEHFVVTDFAIYTDGLAAVSQKTEWSEAFLEDVTSWVINNFGFRMVTGFRKLYSSNIIVDFDTSPSNLLRDFNRISNFIGDRAVTVTHDRKHMDFARLDFEIDKNALGNQAATSKFILERRAGIAFSQERYFSAAPMTTSDHVETLAEIERLAANA